MKSMTCSLMQESVVGRMTGNASSLQKILLQWSQRFSFGDLCESSLTWSISTKIGQVNKNRKFIIYNAPLLLSFQNYCQYITRWLIITSLLTKSLQLIKILCASCQTCSERQLEYAGSSLSYQLQPTFGQPRQLALSQQS